MNQVMDFSGIIIYFFPKLFFIYLYDNKNKWLQNQISTQYWDVEKK